MLTSMQTPQQNVWKHERKLFYSWFKPVASEGLYGVHIWGRGDQERPAVIGLNRSCDHPDCHVCLWRQKTAAQVSITSERNIWSLQKKYF